MRYKPKKFGLYKSTFTTTDGINTVKEENFYKNGKKHGICKWENSLGFSGEDNYKYGKLDGISKFFEDGEIMFETPYKNGKREGITKEYFENILCGEHSYKNDKKHGTTKKYLDGELYRKILYKNDIIIKENRYQNGRIIKKKKGEEMNRMLGAIVGDIVGSRFEWDNIKSKNFKFFHRECFFTDDSVMTLAIANALFECCGNYEDLSNQTIKSMQKIGLRYPDCGYGLGFEKWLHTPNPAPYNSWGNGAAMRVSACAYFAKSIEEAKDLSYKVTAVSHNHEEGIKGAEATTIATYMALHGATKEEIENTINKDYYSMDFTLDKIRSQYRFYESCQQTVPQALKAFFESTDFEDAIRNAISIGGDSDTIAAITGAVAGAYYGIPQEIYIKASSYLDIRLRNIFNATIEHLQYSSF